MATSYNGWSASPRPADFGGLDKLTVAGELFAPGVRAGDVATVLGYVAEQLHARVEPVVRADWHQADDWGYSYRANTNNPSQLSCHASGTAIDYNATRHPNGRGGTWGPAQKAEIARILAEVNGTVRNLTGYDEMHFEIYGTVAQVAAAASKIRGGAVAPAPAPAAGIQWGPVVDAPLGSRMLELGSRGSDVAFVQRWHGLKDDGEFGPATEQAVRNTQERNRVGVDGVVGPVTWALMGVGAPAAPRAIPPLPAAPAWDVPRGQYLGHIAGPNASRGGGAALEREEVLWLQRACIVLGCVPGIGDWRDRWADARWENATTVAVRMLYAKHNFGNEKYPDRIYREDWEVLKRLVGR